MLDRDRSCGGLTMEVTPLALAKMKSMTTGFEGVVEVMRMTRSGVTQDLTTISSMKDGPYTVL